MIFQLDSQETLILREALTVDRVSLPHLCVTHYRTLSDPKSTQIRLGRLVGSGLLAEVPGPHPVYVITLAGKEHLNTPLRRKKPNAYQQA